METLVSHQKHFALLYRLLSVGHWSVALCNRADRAATTSIIRSVATAMRYSSYQCYKALVDSLLKYVFVVEQSGSESSEIPPCTPSACASPTPIWSWWRECHVTIETNCSQVCWNSDTMWLCWVPKTEIVESFFPSCFHPPSSMFAVFTPPPLCFLSSGNACFCPPSSMFAILTPLCVLAVESACLPPCLPYSHSFVSSSCKEAKEAGKPCASDDELEEQQDAMVDPPNTNLTSGLPQTPGHPHGPSHACTWAPPLPRAQVLTRTPTPALTLHSNPTACPFQLLCFSWP